MLSALVKLLNSNGNVVKILVKIYAPIVLFHAHLGITKHFCGIQLLSWEKVQNVITFQKVIEELKLNEILEDFTMHNDAIPANSNTCSTKWLLSKCVLNVIKNYAATTKPHSLSACFMYQFTWKIEWKWQSVAWILLCARRHSCNDIYTADGS